MTKEKMSYERFTKIIETELKDFNTMEFCQILAQILTVNLDKLLQEFDDKKDEK